MAYLKLSTLHFWKFALPICISSKDNFKKNPLFKNIHLPQRFKNGTVLLGRTIYGESDLPISIIGDSNITITRWRILSRGSAGQSTTQLWRNNLFGSRLLHASTINK